jgi:hypothetical protein
MVFIFVRGVGISCCGNNLAWLLAGSGVGARATGGTRRGGGIGGSIGASAVAEVADTVIAAPLAKRSGGGGGGRMKDGGFGTTFGAGGGGGGGKGPVVLLFAGSDPFRDVPQTWSVARQWQHRFVYKYRSNL